MTPSPGKCYFAKDWLQMNSELFVENNHKFIQIPFINFSLASMNVAKGGQRRTIESLSQTMQDFCVGRHSKYVDIWMRRVAPHLKKEVPNKISWFLPQCLGGLGLVSNKGLSGSLFTTDQLKMATQFYLNGKEGKALPYTIRSTKGGKANFQDLSSVSRYEIRSPLFSQKAPEVRKSFWADKFIREDSFERNLTPLLWENLILNEEVIVDDLVDQCVYTNKIRKAFIQSKKLEPLDLDTLITFRGYQSHYPEGCFDSMYEPQNIFLDILAEMKEIQLNN
jgi:hypothetical protein